MNMSYCSAPTQKLTPTKSTKRTIFSRTAIARGSPSPQSMAPAIAHAAAGLLDSGTATVDTWRGSVIAQLKRPHGQVDGDLHIQRRPVNGFPGSGWNRITEHDPDQLRHNVTTALTSAVIELL